MKRLLILIGMMTLGSTMVLIDDASAAWIAGQMTQQQERIGQGTHSGDTTRNSTRNDARTVEKRQTRAHDQRQAHWANERWTPKRHIRFERMDHHRDRHYYSRHHRYDMRPIGYMRHHERTPWWWKAQDRQGRW